MDLQDYGVLNSWIEVDLLKYSDQMMHEKKLLESIIDDLRLTEL
jgi:hypothetical protein